MEEVLKPPLGKVLVKDQVLDVHVEHLVNVVNDEDILDAILLLIVIDLVVFNLL